MPRTRRVAQDDVRENRLVDLFNLTRPENRTRHGTDALLTIEGHTVEFELKTVTTGTGSVSTVRDLGPDHIAKWTGKHWIVGVFDELDLLSCKYGSPDAMKGWIDQKWEYIRVDFEMSGLVPDLITGEVMFKLIGEKDLYTLADARKLHKNRYSAAQYKVRMDRPGGYSYSRMLEIFRDRARYVIQRGATLNNPHIPAAYFADWPEIQAGHAERLRELVRNWLAGAPPQPPGPNDNLRVGPQHFRSNRGQSRPVRR
jgi:hypothetical protein